MRATLVLAVAALLAACAVAPPAESDLPPGWVERDPLVAGSDRWYAANHADDEWAVFLEDGRVSVRPWHEREDDRGRLPFALAPDVNGAWSQEIPWRVSVFRVDDGWLVGFDGGEWGGALWWFSPDGEDRYRISEDRIKAFLSTEHGLLALEGLDHLGLSQGRILRFARGAGGRWEATLFVDLEDAPYAVAREDDGSLIVVTSRRLVRVRPDRTLDVLVDDAFWSVLYSNSVVVGPSGAISIGMRGGVARVRKDVEAYRVSWLEPLRQAEDEIVRAGGGDRDRSPRRGAVLTGERGEDPEPRRG